MFTHHERVFSGPLVRTSVGPQVGPIQLPHMVIPCVVYVQEQGPVCISLFIYPQRKFLLTTRKKGKRKKKKQFLLYGLHLTFQLYCRQTHNWTSYQQKINRRQMIIIGFLGCNLSQRAHPITVYYGINSVCAMTLNIKICK